MTDHTFDDYVAYLSGEADAATWDLGYLKAIIDSPTIGEKLQQSFSGYAMETANRAVKHSLALFCARAWENAHDAISLPNAHKKRLPPQNLRAHWKCSCFDCSTHSRGKRVKDRYFPYLYAYVSTLENPAHGSKRVFRRERLAHNIANSKDRQKLENVGSVNGATLNDLVKLAEQTILLIGKLADLGSKPIART